MAVTDSNKIDLLLKKLAGVAKTAKSTAKDQNNETIASPSLNRGDKIWINSYIIPKTADITAGLVDKVVKECVPDLTTVPSSSGIYLTWLTNLNDWIPPEFDTINTLNTYRVEVYYGPSSIDPTANNSGATKIYAEGTEGTAEYFFDYQAGVLHFYGYSHPFLMANTDKIYIVGYRYIGPLGFNSIFQVVTPQMRQDNNPTEITIRGNTVVEKNLKVLENVEIQGQNLTTNQSVFNLLNTTATTINFAGAATELNLGAVTGTTTIRNDLEILGNDLTTTQTEFNLLNEVTTTVNFAGDATLIEIGSDIGTTNVNNNLTVDKDLSVLGNVTLENDLDIEGNAHIAQDLDVDGDINIDGGDLTVSAATFNLANSNATTINFGGAATNIEIGASTGTTNINNNLDVDGTLNIDGGDLNVSTTTFNLANEVATTVNFAGDATIIEIGSSEGITNVNNNLDVDGDVNIDGGDLTVSTETFNLANQTAKNVNFAGEATNIEIGSQEGVTNVNNNFKVDGDTTFGNRLTVDGIVDVNNSLYVEGETRLSQSLEVENSVKVQNELAVEGDTNITRDLNVGGYIKGGQLVDTTIDCGEY